MALFVNTSITISFIIFMQVINLVDADSNQFIAYRYQYYSYQAKIRIITLETAEPLMLIFIQWSVELY